MAKKDATPPLVSFSITNPVEYLKRWWNAIVGNEGLKLTLQIKPLTAIFIVTVVSGIGFSFGRLTLPDPIIQYLPPSIQPQVQPTPNPWKDTAYSGKLQVSGAKYFLVTTASEAITLQVPPAINLAKLVGKRIMAVGSYNKDTRVLIVSDATDLEILPQSPIPLPTNPPSPSIVSQPSQN